MVVRQMLVYGKLSFAQVVGACGADKKRELFGLTATDSRGTSAQEDCCPTTATRVPGAVVR